MIRRLLCFVVRGTCGSDAGVAASNCHDELISKNPVLTDMRPNVEKKEGDLSVALFTLVPNVGFGSD